MQKVDCSISVHCVLREDCFPLILCESPARILCGHLRQDASETEGVTIKRLQIGRIEPVLFEDQSRLEIVLLQERDAHRTEQGIEHLDKVTVWSLVVESIRKDVEVASYLVRPLKGLDQE